MDTRNLIIYITYNMKVIIKEITAYLHSLQSIKSKPGYFILLGFLAISASLVGCTAPGKIQIGGMGIRLTEKGADSCSVVENRVYRMNEYVISKSGKEITKRPDEVDGYHTCSAKWNKPRIVESELDINPYATGLPRMFVSGGICSAQPTLILDYLGQQYIRIIDTKYYEGGAGNLWSVLPYDFYVPRGIYLNPVERSLAQFTAVTLKQCNTLPNSVRVTGRTKAIGGIPEIDQKIRDAEAKRLPYPYEVIYTGIFYPNEKDLRLDHDNKQLAAFFKRYAENRTNRLIQQRTVKEEQQKAGAALLFLLGAGLHANSPCNNYSISKDEKPWYCPD